MPKLTIDGKEVEAGANLNLIDAAEHVDSEIPHYKQETKGRKK